jgi:hypothetical protein
MLPRLRGCGSLATAGYRRWASTLRALKESSSLLLCGSSSARVLIWMLFLGLASLTCTAAAGSSGSKVYIVQRGDTLSGIANTHGISLAKLLERNKLGRTAAIRPGQRLFIPVKTTSPAPAPERPRLAWSVQAAIDKAKVKPGRWKHIVIHHSGVNTGTMAGMDQYHRRVRHMENGLAYHFVIGNAHGLGDGEVGVGARWTRQLDGGHLISEQQNKVSIGICLVGNFDKSPPTQKQMERLAALISALLKRCHLSPADVTTHQRINAVHTRCPGRHFELQRLLAMLGG